MYWYTVDYYLFGKSIDKGLANKYNPINYKNTNFYLIVLVKENYDKKMKMEIAIKLIFTKMKPIS